MPLPFFQIFHSLLFSLTASLTELSHHRVSLLYFPFFDKPHDTLVALSKLTSRCFHLSSTGSKIRFASLSSGLFNSSWNLRTISWSFNFDVCSLAVNDFLFCEFPFYVTNKHSMFSHHFFTFYIPHQPKIRFSYKNIVWLATNTTWLVGDQMVVFPVEIRVSSNKIISNRKLENIFTVVVN